MGSPARAIRKSSGLNIESGKSGQQRHRYNVETMSAQRFLAARDFLLAHRTDYRAAVRGFAWPQLNAFNWALDYFDPMAAGNPAIALWIVNEGGNDFKITFAEMAERSNRIANFLRRCGVYRGDRIMIMLGNEAPLWEVQLAAFKLGAVVTPATGLLGPQDLRDRMERGQVRHVVADSAYTEKLAASGTGWCGIAVGERVNGWRSLEDAASESASFAPEGVTCATDPLLLYFTSGTTARPKLVQHSHESYPVGHLSTMYWLGLRPGDIHWNISSPGWAKHAWSCFFAPWNAGATVFVHNYSRFQAAEALRILHTRPITTMCAPPTVWRMLIQENLGAAPVHLRELASAGEPLNPEVIEQLNRAWGITVRDGYGQTETTAMVGNSPGQPVKPGSMGRVLPGYEIAFADDGEICLDLACRPTGLMLGYMGDESAQAGDRYNTGDIAEQDSEGYLTYVGRTDDVFKASDYRISPFELESVLVAHASVAEAAVVPCPDPVRGCVPKAFITLVAGCPPTSDTARVIFAFLREHVAPYKRIRRLEFSDLPKTVSGKIRRAELRKSEEVRTDERRKGEFSEEDFLP
jgi:acetyl-CoA synthetase